jgi:hypothetical protein
MALTDNGTAAAPYAATAPPAELPAYVVVGGTPRLTPNELRMLKVVTGRALQDVMSDEADAIQAMVWLKLRRLGHDVSWEAAGDVEADMADAAAPVDPMSGGLSPRSPLSAGTGE